MKNEIRKCLKNVCEVVENVVLNLWRHIKDGVLRKHGKTFEKMGGMPMPNTCWGIYLREATVRRCTKVKCRNSIKENTRPVL